MNGSADVAARNVEVVERFLAAFDRRRLAEDELGALRSPRVRFVERPNLITLPKGARLSAWCVAHYRFEDGRIAEIEQHDCYESVPAAGP